ncbi:PREDICTED: mitochondrial GTPase 1 [Dinoponera quadriceps]|uniref:Mitochondrial GTPase 1 n=1 Tax=Dinoponera quadriceps TaxID=609295 RepID=A0A6P3WYC8_DINQU|nr:PREDICTED: mitochondrial GTPase 1 [Dinoponera quadriceps]
MASTGGKVVANLRKKFVLETQKVIRWFPGHMTKGLKQMQQRLKNVDCIIEVHDARIPLSGHYADYSRTLTSLKPHIFILNKKDLIDTDYSESIVSVLKKEGLSNIILTNLKDQHCKETKKIMPLAKKLILNSNRYNRAGELSYSMMVIGVPNVGKSTLINRLRHNILHMGKATNVGAVAGITRAVLTHVKVSENPTIYLIDTPGILVPAIRDIHTGLKLSLVGCLKDHIVESYILADYLLYWLNKESRYEYTEVLGLSEPNDNVQYVLTFIAAKLKKTLRLKESSGQLIVKPDFQFAADYFISLFRKGELGLCCLDIDLLRSRQDCNVKSINNNV